MHNGLVILNRAVPGSGKTTITKSIIKHLSKHGITVSSHSTDDYFVTESGRYIFEIDKLDENHRSNLNKFTDSVASGTQVVICDNTNITPWQSNPYSEIARKYNYKILCITFEPREIEKHVASQIVTPEKPDAHGVPREVIERFIQEYRLYTPLLDKTNPIDPGIHRDFSWDGQNKMRVPLERTASYFDVDEVLEILPDEYHDMKGVIGNQIMKTLGCL